MTGTTLSHYQITAELGRGGMGIVYLAEDTKLDRQVAIKVLPSSALASEDDRTRFYREAKAAAALNHPNIAQIYQIDEAVPSDAPHGTQPSPFIAMEYIDGEPLDERIKRGPLKLGEAVRLATQIAGALGEAHEKGIVHRDVKASNVMLTSKGDAKVLDFGLALTAASTKLTRMGSTLGTVAYMSPEQARGEEVDRRTDLWALGVVLYEMVAGRNPFGGDYEQAVVYSILNTEPEPLTAVRTGVPMELERIVNKCLSKDADLRYQSATDLLVDLKAIEIRGGSGTTPRVSAHSIASGHGISPPTAAARAGLRRPMLSVAGIVAALLIGLAIGWVLNGASSKPDRPAMTVSVTVPDEFGLSHPTISPDGRYLAFSAEGGKLVLRDLALGTQRVILQGEDVRISRFSPDGRWLVFEHGTEGLSIIQVSGGGTVGELSSEGTTPSWIDNDNLVYSDDQGIFRISRVNQRVDTIWSPSQGDGYSLAHPETISGTDVILVSILREGSQDVGILDLKSGEVTPLIDDAIAGRYVSSGHIVYTEQAGTLSYSGRSMAQPFDLNERETRGPAVPVLSERGFWEFGLNERGDLVTSKDLEARGATGSMDVFRLDPDTGERGAVLQTIPEFVDVTVSPDGTWFAYSHSETKELIVGPLDPAEGGAFRFNAETDLYSLEFSPDNEVIYFSEGPFPTQLDLFSRTLTAGGRLENMDLGGYRYEVVANFSADGSGMLIAYTDDVNESWTNSFVDRNTDSRNVIISASDLSNIDLSPDGRLMAYGRGGDSPGVHVMTVDGQGPWLVARDLGIPKWSHDNRALFARAGNTLYRLPVDTDRGVRAAGEPQQIYTGTTNFRYYVNQANGDLIMVDRLATLERPLDQLDLILNWGERLKIEAPVR